MHYLTLLNFSIAIWLLGLTPCLCSPTASQGGSNGTAETPCIRVQSYDGSYNELCLIFSKGLQIWKSIALGEVDLGHLPVYFMCFVTTLDKDKIEFKDAFLKLKEKFSNQEVPSSDVDKETVHLEWAIDMQTVKQGLGRLGVYCSNADIVYMTKEVVDKIITDESIVNTKLLTAAIESLPVNSESTYPHCEDARHAWELGCICTRHICMAGLPCTSIQCSGKQGHSDKCTVKTCTKCTNFQYYVPNKRTCFWNTKGASSYH